MPFQQVCQMDCLDVFQIVFQRHLLLLFDHQQLQLFLGEELSDFFIFILNFLDDAVKGSIKRLTDLLECPPHYLNLDVLLLSKFVIVVYTT